MWETYIYHSIIVVMSPASLFKISILSKAVCLSVKISLKNSQSLFTALYLIIP